MTGWRCRDRGDGVLAFLRPDPWLLELWRMVAAFMSSSIDRSPLGDAAEETGAVVVGSAEAALGAWWNQALSVCFTSPEETACERHELLLLH